MICTDKLQNILNDIILNYNLANCFLEFYPNGICKIKGNYYKEEEKLLMKDEESLLYKFENLDSFVDSYKFINEEYIKKYEEIKMIEKSCIPGTHNLSII